jgi:polyisoprenoid-binding protein YceI
MNMRKIAMIFAMTAIAYSVNAQRMEVNTSASKLEWKGTKKIGEHAGVIEIKSGYLDLEDGKILGGEFIVDMNAITVLNMDDEGDIKHIIKDISSKQFFNIKEYPTARFTIDSYNNGLLAGILTIKGISNRIQFKADINISGTILKANADTFSIDRQLWKLQFSNWIKENVLDDPLQFKIHIVAESTKA